MAGIYSAEYPIKLPDDNHTYHEAIYVGYDGIEGEDEPIRLMIDTKQKRGKPRVFVIASLPHDVAYALGQALVDAVGEE